MATPRTGKPRGRPRKVKAEAPKRDRGRPAIPIDRDPDFKAIVVAALFMASGKSENEACWIAAAGAIGNKIETTPGALFTVGPRDDGVSVEGVVTDTAPGSKAATIRGKAATIRQKLHSTNEADRVAITRAMRAAAATFRAWIAAASTK